MADEGYLLLKAAADMQKRSYTAAEMREMIERLRPHVRPGGHGYTAISDLAGTRIMAMLRQAADAMDKATKEGE